MKAKYYSTSELAKKTGTSRQVISAILNDSWREKRISQATYERISEAMDEIGYVPDRTAISLRKEKETPWVFFAMVLSIPTPWWLWKN